MGIEGRNVGDIVRLCHRHRNAAVIFARKRLRVPALFVRLNRNSNYRSNETCYFWILIEIIRRFYGFRIHLRGGRFRQQEEENRRLLQWL